MSEIAILYTSYSPSSSLSITLSRSTSASDIFILYVDALVERARRDLASLRAVWEC